MSLGRTSGDYQFHQKGALPKGTLCVGFCIVFFILFWSFPSRKHSSASVPSHVTLVTHASTDKLSQLQAIRSVWPGPLAVAIYGDEEDVNLPGADIVWVHPDSDPRKYPINTLRNKAVDLVQTDMYLMLDADMIPSSDLFIWVQMNILYLTKNAPSLIFILPSFETDEQNTRPYNIYGNKKYSYEQQDQKY